MTIQSQKMMRSRQKNDNTAMRKFRMKKGNSKLIDFVLEAHGWMGVRSGIVIDGDRAGERGTLQK